MKYLIVLLVLSSLILVSCSDNNGPEAVPALSSGAALPLAKGSTKISCPSKVKYAGKTYNTVLIGSQCWLKENLDVGTMILGTDSAKNNGTIEKYCYNDDPANCATYGGMYQWNEVMQYSTTAGAQGLCPKGWHIPTQTEFQALALAVGNDGYALEAVGQGAGATNTSGFSALLGGALTFGTFFHLGNFALIWSSTESDAMNAANVSLGRYDNAINLNNNIKDFGFSVRCIKD